MSAKFVPSAKTPNVSWVSKLPVKCCNIVPMNIKVAMLQVMLCILIFLAIFIVILQIIPKVVPVIVPKIMLLVVFRCKILPVIMPKIMPKIMPEIMPIVMFLLDWDCWFVIVLFVLNFLMLFTALDLSGERNTMNATICSQVNGMVKEPICTYSKEYGLTIKTPRRSAYRTIMGIHLRFIRKPIATQLIKPGRKSNPKNTIGLLIAAAVNVPIITLMPPANGPNTMPISGAKASENENVPANPIIGPNGK